MVKVIEVGRVKSLPGYDNIKLTMHFEEGKDFPEGKGVQSVRKLFNKVDDLIGLRVREMELQKKVEDIIALLASETGKTTGMANPVINASNPANYYGINTTATVGDITVQVHMSDDELKGYVTKKETLEQEMKEIEEEYKKLEESPVE